MALAIDLAPRERLGAAMATYTMAYQLAEGGGGLLGGLMIDLAGYRTMYLMMILPCLASLWVVFNHAGSFRKSDAAASS